MTSEHERPEDTEQPKTAEPRQSGFMGKRGHPDPTPPGGRNPGGGPENPARLHHEDYADDPLDPRVPNHRTVSPEAPAPEDDPSTP
jgi:hypothetical protein